MDDDSGVGLTAEDLLSTPMGEQARRNNSLSVFGRRSSFNGAGAPAAVVTHSASVRNVLDGSAAGGGGDPWATPMRTPVAGRKSGRFVEHDVLSALKNAPELPSPAIKANNTLDWSAMGTSTAGQEAASTQHSGYWGAQQSPDGRIDKLNQSTTWLPTPKAMAGRGEGVSQESPKGGRRDHGMWESSVDASMVSRQVLETQQPEFISLLERSIVLPPRYPSSAAAVGQQTGVGPVREEDEDEAEEEGSLEADLRRAEVAAPPGRLGVGEDLLEDLEVEEVWEELMLWCSSHGASVDIDAHAELGRGLDVWRIEAFSPVLLPHGRMGALNDGDAYLVLNRVDDRTGAIGHVNDAYHDRKSRVKTLWTMHFWVGAHAHPLKHGVAAALAVELCSVLKRHARPIREEQGMETDIFRWSKPARRTPSSNPRL